VHLWPLKRSAREDTRDTRAQDPHTQKLHRMLSSACNRRPAIVVTDVPSRTEWLLPEGSRSPHFGAAEN